jgi:uncharacterized lipoprotein YehR (DUF1307 family)
MVDLLSEQGERVISQTFKYPEKELSLSLGENLTEARYILQISHKNLPIYTTYLDVIENQDYVYKKTRFVDGLKKKESVYEAFEGNRYEEAMALHDEVAQAYQDAGNLELAARSWEDLAEEFHRINQPSFALQALEDAKKILQGLGNQMEAVERVEEKIGICREKTKKKKPMDISICQAKSLAADNDVDVDKVDALLNSLQREYNISIPDEYIIIFYLALTGFYCAEELAQLFNQNGRSINSDFNRYLGQYLQDYLKLERNNRLGITSLRRTLYRKGYFISGTAAQKPIKLAIH